jgi:hypothetical protein
MREALAQKDSKGDSALPEVDLALPKPSKSAHDHVTQIPHRCTCGARLVHNERDR